MPRSWDFSDPKNPPVPFYDRSEGARVFRAIVVKMLDAFGTHLICPRIACERAGRCVDTDMRDKPFCFYHYRGMVRFALIEGAKAEGIRPGPSDREDLPMPEPFCGISLLARLREEGAPIHLLARPAEAGPCDWDYETDPEAKILLKRWAEEA